MPRYLRSRKTGRILPWNEHRVAHPDLYEWEGDPLNPDPEPQAKATAMPKTEPAAPKPRKRRRTVKKEMVPEVGKEESASLLKGLIGE